MHYQQSRISHSSVASCAGSELTYADSAACVVRVGSKAQGVRGGLASGEVGADQTVDA